ncbi:GNAT family N-acetyltransferase [bacterium LRH843]|nr:GNAT family N-acetyltransferase [bacterium LRH843]
MTNREVEEVDPEVIEQNLAELEYQLYRMQENMKQIAKKWQIIGIDQTNEDKWVIVSIVDDGHICKIMLNECDTAFRGVWDFTIQAQYEDTHTIHIGDIKGEENKGFGSICMKYLKEHAIDRNIQFIKGDLAKRDWNHLDRLVHFYKKHHFHISINHSEQSGEIKWNAYV